MNTPTRPDRLYAANVGLAGKVLSRFPSLTGEAREEAYGAALLGLWQAAGRFDPARGFTFATFACDYIRGHILRHLTRQRRQNRVPTVSLDAPSAGTAPATGEVPWPT